MNYNIALAKILIEIGILWFVYYGILLFARGTRGVYVLRGITLITLFFIITKQLGFERINWILTKIFALSVLAFLIIFQQEIRRGLANIGQRRWSRFFLKESEIIKEITTACFLLSKRKIGALIAIERETRLENYIESGIDIDAKVNSELLMTIFMPNTPLHDGGIVIAGERPLSDSLQEPPELFGVATVDMKTVAYVDVPADPDFCAKAFGNLLGHSALQVGEREYVHETCLVGIARTPVRIHV